ncbi:MAG: recombinase family protein [Candidatus Yanofskybacteria bacterium]|nr:recombinase family protein [Candidatus Yanofskybacteria bacterium]
MEINNKKLIATYARVSTSNQEEEQTIKTQLHTLGEFAQKNDYTIVKEYMDEGWSGDVLARPALDELRQDAKNKIWDAVLIYDPDRLARRYSYQELVMDELREAGVEVIFITISAPKNPEDKILHGVRGLFAEYERVKISERFRLGKIRKIKEGHVLTTEAPYGYTYIRGNREKRIHGYYQINEEEARVVKQIFHWIADEGLTTRGVVRRLQELSIKPKKSQRGVWNTSTLITMVRNKSYIGEAHWGRCRAVIPVNPIKKDKYRKTQKSSRKIRPEEEWISSKIPVPAIIERELFIRVQAQLKINAHLCTRNRKHDYLLSGKIHCVCGRTRSGAGPQRGKHLYYRCNDRIYSFSLPHTCKEQSVNARIADKLVWDRIANFISSPELMHSTVRKWIDSRKAKIKNSANDIEPMGKEITKLKAQEERYNKAYGAELITIEQLKEYTTPLRNRVAILESQIAKASQESEHLGVDAIPSLGEIRAFAKVATERLKNLNFETKQVIVRKIVDKIMSSQRQLEVHCLLPLTLDYVVYETSHRYSRAAKRGKEHPLQGPDEKTS